MKAIISTTYSDTYLFFLPITVFAWNRIGVDVICFMPAPNDSQLTDYKVAFGDSPASRMIIDPRYSLIINTMSHFDGKFKIEFFIAPEHKQATYAQCLRNYASALDLDETELLVTSDIDMAVFKVPPYNNNEITIWGSDLVPAGQFPQCYVTGTVNQWREAFGVNGRTYQKCIDDLLGDDDCQDYRACRWQVDQEQSFLNISKGNYSTVPRSNGQNQFAVNRVDRIDSFWRDRLNHDIVDAHLWRPGYTEENFSQIMELLTFMYPNDNLQWIRDYREAYVKLIENE